MIKSTKGSGKCLMSLQVPSDIYILYIYILNQFSLTSPILGCDEVNDMCPDNYICYKHKCEEDCPLPCQTVVNGECQPECCQDADCPIGMPLCNADGICTDGCREGHECDGYNRPCHEPWQQGDDNCEYCDNVDTSEEIGQCQPGIYLF